MRAFASAAVAVVVVLASMLVAAAPVSASPPAEFTNPLIPQRADPHIHKHSDGYYYYTATVPEYDRIIMRRSTTLAGLASAAETVIWRRPASGQLGGYIWAPEIHYINGNWYIYFAAGDADNVWRIRMYVLENTSANPMTGSWTVRGPIVTHLDTFSLDATTFVHNGTRYLAWAQNDPAVGSGTSLYLAALANPWTISGTPVRISTPTHSWETIGHRVNEGPAVIQRNGRVFMTFSASATDANYAIGLLTASASSNLLNPASWTKNPQPVFQSNDATSQYGPGHNSFTVSEDGESDILVYHSRSYRDINGEPLNDPNRATRLQKLYWNADGTPNLGIPLANGPTPYRFKSYNFQDRFIRHWEFRARIDPNVTSLADSQFRIVPGLAGNGTVSLESANFPGYYLRHRNYEIWLESDNGSSLFRADASFYRRSGLASSAGVSLESYNFPGYYLRHYEYVMYLQQIGTATDQADATYILE